MTHLRPDPEPTLRSRRDVSCAHLPACEDGWIQAHGSAQARCPKPCPHRAARVPPDAPLRGHGPPSTYDPH